MTDKQQLGGSRKGEPLADEDCYPLTLDEYLTIKENLTLEKFTSFESVLFSTFIATLISGIVFLFTGTFYKLEMIENVNKEIINLSHIVIIIVYGAVSLGSLIGLIIFKITKKRTKKSIERLDEKIIKHLEKART